MLLSSGLVGLNQARARSNVRTACNTTAGHRAAGETAANAEVREIRMVSAL